MAGGRIISISADNADTLANFRIIPSPPAAGLQNAALEREALVKERVRDAPAECVSQQAGTILSTLMLRARTMPPNALILMSSNRVHRDFAVCWKRLSPYDSEFHFVNEGAWPGKRRKRVRKPSRKMGAIRLPHAASH
jgi:hypothetical protein